uniref:Uncharacterized protein LOC113784856 n=1 Tax=Cicer arietinum TaxID=3827 RepID=A0A3Q7WZ74_CICAR|nr:uncharacterized protein LOC113784856 [Cicer arietinum]
MPKARVFRVSPFNRLLLNWTMMKPKKLLGDLRASMETVEGNEDHVADGNEEYVFNGSTNNDLCVGGSRVNDDSQEPFIGLEFSHKKMLVHSTLIMLNLLI